MKRLFALLTGVLSASLSLSSCDGGPGEALYTSDLTEAGTKLVKKINTNSSSDPSSFVEMGMATYFAANDGVTGTELVMDRLPGAGSGVTAIWPR